MSAPSYRTITEAAAAAVRAGKVSSVELLQRAVAIADAVDDALGIFLARFTDSALAAAAMVDDRLAAGDPVGPLAGIPVGIKDVIATRETATTAQSLVLDPSWSRGDAVVVQRLRAAGAIVVGKLTTMEFAIGVPDPEGPFPLPRNPWNLDRWAGGSSSGSGSGIATGAVLGALGTDTGGSIRVPAAYCGISGLKPTFGRVPKSGCVPVSHTLDHVGPMARGARDCALLLSVMSGPDASDPTSIQAAMPDYLSALTGELDGVCIGVDSLAGVSGEFADPALPAALDAALAALVQNGATIASS